MLRAANWSDVPAGPISATNWLPEPRLAVPATVSAPNAPVLPGEMMPPDPAVSDATLPLPARIPPDTAVTAERVRLPSTVSCPCSTRVGPL